MFEFKYFLAVALLSTSPADNEFPNPAQMHALVGPAIQEVALAWELLDARETRFLGHHPDDFAGDLKVLQDRNRELARAPLLEECSRFPVRTVIGEFLASNRSYRNELAARLEVDRVHAEEIRAA